MGLLTAMRACVSSKMDRLATADDKEHPCRRYLEGTRRPGSDEYGESKLPVTRECQIYYLGSLAKAFMSTSYLAPVDLYLIQASIEQVRKDLWSACAHITPLESLPPLYAQHHHNQCSPRHDLELALHHVTSKFGLSSRQKLHFSHQAKKSGISG